METPRFTTSPSTPSNSQRSFGSIISSPSDGEYPTSATKLGNNWHYSFEVPWNMLPAVLKKKLANQERPTARERREVIRIVAAEIIAICNKPSKKHLSEIARQMVPTYPKSFKDEIEDEIIGSGHDSLTKQLQCRVDNYKRNETLTKQKSPPDDGSTVPEIGRAHV